MNEYTKANVEKISQDVHKLSFADGRELHLIGTAHVSADSARLVEETIHRVEPDTIAVELDKQRLEVLQNRKRYENTDIIEIIKKKRALFFTAQLIMSAYQKKIAKKLGVTPGAEFKKAVDLSGELKTKLVLADRDLAATLKRLIRKMTFWDKIKAFAALLFAGEAGEEIDEEKIAELKKSDTLTALIAEMGEIMPKMKQVILDERDLYLAGKIQQHLGQKTVAVVGAAHVPGIIRSFERKISEEELKEIELIPPASKMIKILPWILPAAVLFFFIYGFASGNSEMTGKAAIYWILINGVLTSIGCILALGHPLTIPAGFFAAPITSLNPMIGAGMVTGLVQILLVRPKVKDFESAADDASTFRGWWRNRLTRALLVTIFGSLGSAIGTFIAFPLVVKLLLS
ncbi:MAG: TraB/GumN family protein [Candidatus Aminicenantes bacterium]|nr:TraB/GumN family protein [Candidatus Aminicenantes bacterium]